VLELKESIGDVIEAGVASGGTGELVARDALVELGYTVMEAERALAAIDPALSPEERVREALRQAA
jgi:Holliday junction resolvasome RuvABC DNA-binding subunit